MRKKVLSLALALALCLGLTIPAFAAETCTYTWEGVTITAHSNGSVNYTGAGKLTVEHAEVGAHTLYEASYEGTAHPRPVEGFSNKATISVGQGLTMTDEFKEAWNVCANHYGWSVSFDGSTTPAQPEQPQQPAGTAASPTNDKLEVDGAAADPTVYKINGSNYFKIRDVAALLNGTEKQFAVGYDGSKNAVTATTGQGYEKQPGDLAGAAKGGDQSANPSNDAIYVNGEKITAEVYKINGSNYFKLRDLGRALDFYVGWSANRGVYIETGKPYSE